MTRYALDSDFFVNVQRLHFAAPLAACGALPVVVTDVVWSELTNGTNPTRNAEMARVLAAVAGAPYVIQPQSAEAASFAALQAPPRTEDPGEHSIIAVAIHDPDITPVLLDKKGLHRAVEELRRPLLSMHGFLDVLVQAGLMGEPLARGIGTAYRKHCHAPAPLWW